ncbi:MAG: tRNA lysidine(34) synthetase TilS [Armatimonadota bacterium]
MVEKLLAAVERFEMLSRGDSVLCAVSGGPDSVAMLHALNSLDLGISLSVAHLNHGIRPDSDADAEYVRALAERLGLPFFTEKVDVPRLRRTLRLSEEEAARMARYDFLERAADEAGASRIAVGHTADDQVETVILNLLRGTGVDGLAGMPPVRGRIVRPLILARRSEVAEYVAAHELSPRTDISNLDTTYTRNRVRHTVLPLLRAEFNPEVDGAILRLSELARDDSAYLKEEAEEFLSEAVVSRTEKTLILNIALLPVQPAVLRRVLRLAAGAVRGGLANLGFGHVEELLRLLETGRDFRYDLPGAFVERAGRELRLHTERPASIPIEYCRELALPGRTEVPEIGSAIEAEVSDERVEPVRPAGSPEAVLDAGAVSGKLIVRNWRPGDRVHPLGLVGTKKVQDIFVDAKIPREGRALVPIIEDGDKILWVAGLVVSEEAKVTESTREFLVLRVCTPDFGML